jgi:hypothetical protein
VTTYREWRVFGTPRLLTHSWTFPNDEEARRFITDTTANRTWTDGPYLLKRTGPDADWEDA